MNQIVFGPLTFTELRDRLLVDAPMESVAFLLCGRHDADGIRLLVREVEIPSGEDYMERGPSFASVSPSFVARVLQRARRDSLSIVMAHSHPGGIAQFSAADDAGERAIMPAFFRRAAGPHGSMVLSETGVDARLHTDVSNVVRVDRVEDMHGTVTIIEHEQRSYGTAGVRHERSIRALGRDGQAALQAARLAIVGAGGTGSIVAEELAHLGARSILVVDPDVVEETNLNRLVGASLSDIGRQKVLVVSDNVRRIDPECKVVAIPHNVVDNGVANRLLSCDLIFCCTDSHGSRALLNQVAYQYYIPVIDVGVAIVASRDTITSAVGRVQALMPGRPCLICGALLDSEEVRRDFLTEYQKSLDPYISGAHEPQPAVISINGVVSSLGVTMALSLLIGFPSDARHQIYNIINGTVRRVSSTPASNCVVCSLAGALGRADAWHLPSRRSE